MSHSGPHFSTQADIDRRQVLGWFGAATAGAVVESSIHGLARAVRAAEKVALHSRATLDDLALVRTVFGTSNAVVLAERHPHLSPMQVAPRSAAAAENAYPTEYEVRAAYHARVHPGYQVRVASTPFSRSDLLLIGSQV